MFIKGIKNFFPVPNLIFSLGLSGTEMSLYMYLMYLEDREKHTCHPSFKTIGKALKMSKTTVKKYVDSLVEKRLISVEQTSIVTKKGVKRNGTLLYTILPIQNALDYYNEQQAIIAQNQNKNSSNFYCRNKQRGLLTPLLQFTSDGDADCVRDFKTLEKWTPKNSQLTPL